MCSVGGMGVQRRVSKVVDNTGQVALKRGSQMSFFCIVGKAYLSSWLVNPRVGGVLRYTSVMNCGHNFSDSFSGFLQVILNVSVLLQSVLPKHSQSYPSIVSLPDAQQYLRSGSLALLPVWQKVGWNKVRARVKPQAEELLTENSPRSFEAEEIRPLSSGSVTCWCP